MKKWFMVLSLTGLIAGLVTTTSPAMAEPIGVVTKCKTNDLYVQCTTAVVDADGSVSSLVVSTENLSKNGTDICGLERTRSSPDTSIWFDMPPLEKIDACVPGEPSLDRTGKVEVVWPGPFFDRFYCSRFAADDLTRSPTPCVDATAVVPALSPRTASGCSTSNSLKQCILVYGTGNYVNYVKGTQYGPSFKMCGTEKVFKAGKLYKSGSMCVPANGSASLTWTLNHSYSSGTTFCTQYTTNAGTNSGKPCEIVS